MSTSDQREDQAESADERLERCLLLAAQMETMASLYPGLVHDLKSPLNALVVNLELLRTSLSEHPDIERQRRYADVLEEELARLNRSVESLLPAASPVAGERGRFDLRQVLEQVQALLAPSARHHRVRLEVAGEDRRVLVEGHRDRFRQAILGLAVNGLEAMPEGGVLGLRTEMAGDRVTLAVEDTGSGVPEEVRDRLFEPYVTTKEQRSGLGLYAARRVVESMSGTLELSLLPGGGSRFEITLPLAAKSA